MSPWMYLGVELHPALLWHLHRQVMRCCWLLVVVGGRGWGDFRVNRFYLRLMHVPRGHVNHESKGSVRKLPPSPRGSVFFFFFASLLRPRSTKTPQYSNSTARPPSRRPVCRVCNQTLPPSPPMHPRVSTILRPSRTASSRRPYWDVRISSVPRRPARARR